MHYCVVYFYCIIQVYFAFQRSKKMFYPNKNWRSYVTSTLTKTLAKMLLNASFFFWSISHMAIANLVLCIKLYVSLSTSSWKNVSHRWIEKLTQRFRRISFQFLCKKSSSPKALRVTSLLIIGHRNFVGRGLTWAVLRISFFEKKSQVILINDVGRTNCIP